MVPEQHVSQLSDLIPPNEHLSTGQPPMDFTIAFLPRPVPEPRVIHLPADQLRLQINSVPMRRFSRDFSFTLTHFGLRLIKWLLLKHSVFPVLVSVKENVCRAHLKAVLIVTTLLLDHRRILNRE